jgi:hypothetical protein
MMISSGKASALSPLSANRRPYRPRC